MRRPIASLLLLASLFAGGCAVRVKDLTAEGPVLETSAREKVWPASGPSGVTYTSEPHEGPIPLPFMVFGVTYDVDIVLVSKHPDWNMHELAMVKSEAGPVWLVKEAREETLEQVIVADVENVDAWFPEVPVARKGSPVNVSDRSTERKIDVKVSWENFDGDDVTAHFRGRRPHRLAYKRNGPTMGHSRDAVIAVLDVSKKAWGSKGGVRFNDKRMPLRHILGVIPFRFVLAQTQGGISITDFRMRAVEGAGVEGGFESTFGSPSGSRIPATWQWKQSIGDTEHARVETSNDMRTIRYTYRRAQDTGAWELTHIDVDQWGQPEPPTHIELSPPLPDLRRHFEGRHTSQFVVDVNGQRSHAVGSLTTFWEDDVAIVLIDPEQPPWTADRPMRSEIRFENGEIHLRTTRREKKTPP